MFRYVIIFSPSNNLFPLFINNKLGTKKLWRKTDIIADAIWEMINESQDFTGNQLIDEEYLKTKGVSDFSKYQVVPGYEPPKLLELFNQQNKG